jgi:predicted GNAT family acetyltransferase
MSDPTDSAVVHDPEGRHWTVAGEAGDARLDYSLSDGVLTIRHTAVPQAMSGRGIAGRLVAAAVEFARGHGYRVRPACEYAEVWMARHPEHDDLRA